MAQKNNLPSAYIDRLALGKNGLRIMTDKVQSVIKLSSGLDECIEERSLQKGLVLRKVRVPIGTIFVIYESRPEVTIDVAALCIKSGNIAILKGGSEAQHTNRELITCIQTALEKTGLPSDCVNFVDSSSRKTVYHLIKQNHMIDLVIARGGYKMVSEIMDRSTIPVLAHAAGGARYYIDKSADLSIVEKIIINAKTTKPAACNSADTILIHQDVAGKITTSLVNALQKNDVTVKGDLKVKRLTDVELAKNEDWQTEFLSKTISIKIVDDLDTAITFINKYSKHHSEAIIAQDTATINRFRHETDAAALFINCSTRLHDGYVFGLGSEMGIATGKLHARGPVGLKELTTFTWELYGNGHIRT